MNESFSYKFLFLLLFIFILIFVFSYSLYNTFFNFKNDSFVNKHIIKLEKKKYWEIRSIDVMKVSRDLAREKLNDHSFDLEIDKQVLNIKKTGANYIGIGTPYDAEFLPILKRWVSSARKYNLKIWFRGNFSGWEKWFGYNKIDKQQHILLTKKFLNENIDLFEDDDIFTPCPECENGWMPDFNNPSSIEEYRNFLITEKEVSDEIFANKEKKVLAGYFSMNGDVARHIMDKNTTKRLGGIVVIDHYVKSPIILAQDIKDFESNSGGRVLLGEFGAPIPDIHGKMSDDEQKKWIQLAMAEISKIKDLVGVNYWVNKGGSTAIWTEEDFERPAVEIIRNYYSKIKAP